MPSFIIESAIYQEAKMVKSTPSKAVFRMTLQSSDEVNQNRRMYPKKVLVEGMEGCNERMRRRAFFGELDHPLLQGNEEFDTMRQTTVSLERVSHLIRDYEFKGNHLVSELETTSTPKGGILLGLLRDRTGVGMSMRGLAEVERGAKHSIVKSPLTIISFDSVSLPSHAAAVVDFNEMKFESHVLMEHAGLICYNGRCFLPDYFDKLVETRCIKFFSKWI